MDEFTRKVDDLIDAMQRCMMTGYSDFELLEMERAKYAFTEHLRDAINLVINGADIEPVDV